MPISYSPVDTEIWEPLARLTLEAAYESTLAVALVNAHITGNRTTFLTLLGGGAFGNPTEWILDAIDRSLRLTFREDLDIAIVSYGSVNPALAPLLSK